MGKYSLPMVFFTRLEQTKKSMEKEVLLFLLLLVVVLLFVVIIIFKLKPIDIESFVLIFRTIRLGKTLTTGPPRMNEV